MLVAFMTVGFKISKDDIVLVILMVMTTDSSWSETSGSCALRHDLSGFQEQFNFPPR